MPEINVTIVLPSGGVKPAEVPDDVTVQDLLMEFASLLQLPTTGPDGRPMAYRMDSKALGRELKSEETLADAGVPENDRLMLTADITAGAGNMQVGESPRMRRLRGDYELMQEMAARSDLISFKAISPRPNLPPERYVVTFKCRSIIDVDRQGNPKYADHHQVEVYLHNQYPQRWPGMKWLTPIWHPNINHLNGSVCIDAAWWTASRSLDRLVIMLGEMLQWKNFHDDPTKPPFPWDPEAARWSREYRKKYPDAFPVDERELMRPERVKLNAADRATKNALDAKNGAFDTPIKKKPVISLKSSDSGQTESKSNVPSSPRINVIPQRAAEPKPATNPKVGITFTNQETAQPARSSSSNGKKKKDTSLSNTKQEKTNVKIKLK
jgi:ubiquitin-protein ligase